MTGSPGADTPCLDTTFVRAQFPAFSAPELAGWVHFENAGGSYAAGTVIDALQRLFVTAKVQPYYAHDAAQRAGAAMDRSHDLLAATIGSRPEQVHLGPSTTQNTYVLAQAVAATLEPGDEIVVTEQDHEANVGAWRRLAEHGAVVREWRVDPTTGLLDVSDLDELIGDRTRWVAVTHSSNVAATTNPVRDVADRAHAVGARVCVDGVAHAPHAAIDVEALGCDVYLYSTYKTYGPHLGLMYVRDDLLAELPNQSHFFNAEYDRKKLVPAGPDHAAIGAAGGIVDHYRAVHAHHWPDATDVDDVTAVRAVFELFAEHEERLMAPLLELLVGRDGVHVVGDTSADRARRAPTIAFHTERSTSTSVYQGLTDAGIACGHGDFYARRLVHAIGIEDPSDGVVRLSMVHYNTVAEVDRAIEALERLLT